MRWIATVQRGSLNVKSSDVCSVERTARLRCRARQCPGELRGFCCTADPYEFIQELRAASVPESVDKCVLGFAMNDSAVLLMLELRMGRVEERNSVRGIERIWSRQRCLSDDGNPDFRGEIWDWCASRAEFVAVGGGGEGAKGKRSGQYVLGKSCRVLSVHLRLLGTHRGPMTKKQRLLVVVLTMGVSV